RINMKAANPTWDTVADLNCGRTHTQLVVLPDGKVLAVGGDADACDFEYHAVLPAELYDPAADTWTLMAGTNVSRWVHSIALLLPDGRVLTANGEPPCEVCDLCGGLNNYATEQECLNDPMCNASTCSHWDYCQTCPNADAHPGGETGPASSREIFSPPYLFQPNGQPAVRPTITAVSGGNPAEPHTIRYGRRIRITTVSAQDITKVNLVRLGAVTHGFDQDQRFVGLKFAVSDPITLNAVGPVSPYIAPPGYYMLFILDDGVPSVATIVKLEP
ncbi:MAG: galactose oxidase-like domain-containing protein, partial [Phycisphaerae bacterium]